MVLSVNESLAVVFPASIVELSVTLEVVYVVSSDVTLLVLPTDCRII